jgi:outer membrane lipoprotein SlyB
MKILKFAVVAAALGFAGNAAAQVVFYEHDGFTGRQFTAEGSVGNFDRYGFNDRASSVVVLRDRWEVCTDAGFNGNCVVLRPGRYPSMSAFGLNDRISSVRPVGRAVQVEERRYAPPPPMPVYDNYRRSGERLYDANVTSVRAVYVADGGQQRCWVDRDRVVGDNIGGAIVGGLLGGVIGHQIGGGRGNDVATAGGALAGAAIGSRASGGSRDVQRCENVPTSGRIDHYDVTYDFRGVEHFMQTTVPPGPTVVVNEQGEPRG